jgi:hypothetical protein
MLGNYVPLGDGLFKVFIKNFTSKFSTSIAAKDFDYSITLDWDPSLILPVVVETLGLFTIEINMLFMAGKVLV